MLRQLTNAPADVRVTVAFTGTRETTSVMIGEAREYPQRLLSPTDAKREPRSFELALSRALGSKSGKGQGSFVRDTRAQVVDFYGELVQNLKRWQPPAPKLADTAADVPETPQAEPPPFAADARDIGAATTPTEPPVRPKPEQPGYE